MSGYIPLNIIKQLAIKEGFCDCGAAQCTNIDISHFKDWISKGYHGSMKYLENYFMQRENPSLLFDGTKTVFCFLLPYNDITNNENHPFKIASYAQRKDYHYVIKQKLNSVIKELQNLYPELQAKAFVDTAPIKERDWAVRCGLGWKGKNSLLVTKKYGNKVFIGEILASCTSDYTFPMKNLCGKCNKCIASCPNNAIMNDGSLNCNLCISYQTIENKGDIPPMVNLNHYIYGCDICLEACIWNNKAEKIPLQDTEVKDIISKMLDKIKNGQDFKAEFQMLRKISPMDRIKYSKILANVSMVRNQLNKDTY